MTYTLKHSYNSFIRDNPSIDIGFYEYKKLCMDFSDAILEEVLFTGKKFYMGSNLSYLQVKRIERNPNNPRVDWPSTNKTKINGELPIGENGSKILTYYTNKWYPLLYWNKKETNIKHGKLYRLKMIRGVKGSHPKFVEVFKNENMINERFSLVKRIVYTPKIKNNDLPVS